MLSLWSPIVMSSRERAVTQSSRFKSFYLRRHLRLPLSPTPTPNARYLIKESSPLSDHTFQGGLKTKYASPGLKQTSSAPAKSSKV